MDNEKKDNRKLLRIYIRPDTEREINEWCENQQNVSISVKTLIRMAIAVKGTRDILTLPFGENALVQPAAQPSEAPAKQDSRAGEPQKNVSPKKSEKGSLNDIRSAYYGISEDDGTDDMDVFGGI